MKKADHASSSQNISSVLISLVLLKILLLEELSGNKKIRQIFFFPRVPLKSFLSKELQLKKKWGNSRTLDRKIIMDACRQMHPDLSKNSDLTLWHH